MLAQSAFELVERDVRNGPHVDADRGQSAAAPYAAREPLVECAVIRNGAGTDDILYVSKTQDRKVKRRNCERVSHKSAKDAIHDRD